MRTKRRRTNLRRTSSAMPPSARPAPPLRPQSEHMLTVCVPSVRWQHAEPCLKAVLKAGWSWRAPAQCGQSAFLCSALRAALGACSTSGGRAESHLSGILTMQAASRGAGHVPHPAAISHWRRLRATALRRAASTCRSAVVDGNLYTHLRLLPLLRERGPAICCSTPALDALILYTD
jgi:hypothetical protein